MRSLATSLVVLLALTTSCDSAPTGPQRPSAGHDVVAPAAVLTAPGSYAFFQVAGTIETSVRVDVYPSGAAVLRGMTALRQGSTRQRLDSISTATRWSRTGDTLIIHMPRASVARVAESSLRFQLVPDGLLELDCFCDAPSAAKLVRVPSIHH